MIVTLVDRFEHLAIFDSDSNTVNYYYNEWKPNKPPTVASQGQPVLTRSYNTTLDAMTELYEHGYFGPEIMWKRASTR